MRPPVLVGAPEILEELRIGSGLLERIQLRAVEVLSRASRRRFSSPVSRMMAGNDVQASLLGRPPPPLAP
jgi:hypothetical protein